MTRWLVLLASWIMASEAQAETTAFYYGPAIPPELSASYDQIVIEPGHPHDLAALARGRAVPVAYLSIGEVSPDKQAGVDPAWRVGQNAAWASAVMDLTHPGYRAFVITSYEKLWSAGYRRFFLDTLDSYQLGTKDPKQRELQRRALCELIATMAKRHPEARWLLNRGFELLPDIASHVHGVVAESLFDRWDAGAQRYVRVPEPDRTWLLGKLREVKSRYKLPVIVIDYRPTSERAQARETARKIMDLGFEPWVCNAALNDLGVGAVEVLPRRIMIVTDRPNTGADLGPARYLAPVLEYLGYVPEYHTLEQRLPDYPLVAHYAGLISMFEPGASRPEYAAWLTKQLHGGLRVAIFGGLGFAPDSPLARELGMRPIAPAQPGRAQAEPIAITQRDTLIGFEAEPAPHGPEGAAIHLEGPSVQRHLELRTGHGALATAIATAPFGGIALSHVFARRGLGDERAWVLDPFAFISAALQLPVMPVPDVTTESGRRTALFVVDATGLADNARVRGGPAVAAVLQEKVLAKYRWPHALAVASDANERDRSAAQRLLAQRVVYAAQPKTGSTAERGAERSLTGIAPLWAADDPTTVPLPIAPDLTFVGPLSEAYPVRRVTETFDYTEQPRRLRPLALHYHAFVLSSPGGIDAIGEVYTRLAQRPLFGLRVQEYQARIEAFREQVVARTPDGAFVVTGGDALRTLRIPEALGYVDLARSQGIAGSTGSTGTRYVTFVARGPRRLQVSLHPTAAPELRSTNGRVERFEVSSRSPLQLSLEVTGEGALELQLAGLPAQARCELALPKRSVVARSDDRGELRLALAESSTGVATLTCAKEPS
ncbi:MAG: endo alpha-1,4 polygalactosaminidase [Polyangiales bacterium]